MGQVELPIEGMSCASCAARVDRKLNELAGVTASVDFATERASVSFERRDLSVWECAYRDRV